MLDPIVSSTTSRPKLVDGAIASGFSVASAYIPDTKSPESTIDLYDPRGDFLISPASSPSSPVTEDARPLTSDHCGGYHSVMTPLTGSIHQEILEGIFDEPITGSTTVRANVQSKVEGHITCERTDASGNSKTFYVRGSVSFSGDGTYGDYAILDSELPKVECAYPVEDHAAKLLGKPGIDHASHVMMTDGSDRELVKKGSQIGEFMGDGSKATLDSSIQLTPYYGDVAVAYDTCHFKMAYDQKVYQIGQVNVHGSNVVRVTIGALEDARSYDGEMEGLTRESVYTVQGQATFTTHRVLSGDELVLLVLDGRIAIDGKPADLSLPVVSVSNRGRSAHGYVTLEPSNVDAAGRLYITGSVEQGGTTSLLIDSSEPLAKLSQGTADHLNQCVDVGMSNLKYIWRESHSEVGVSDLPVGSNGEIVRTRLDIPRHAVLEPLKTMPTVTSDPLWTTRVTLPDRVVDLAYHQSDGANLLEVSGFRRAWVPDEGRVHKMRGEDYYQAEPEMYSTTEEITSDGAVAMICNNILPAQWSYVGMFCLPDKAKKASAC